MKPTLAAVLILCLVFTSTFSEATYSLPRVPHSAFCQTRCEERCSLAKEKYWCLEYCGICCDKCNCVPTGTSGNKDECPCYKDLRLKKKNCEALHKCP